MAKQLNELARQEIRRRFGGFADCLVVDVSGIPGVQTAALRRDLRQDGGRLQVVKNRLASRALAQTGLEAVAPLLDGPSALAVGRDVSVLAKRLLEWQKKNGFPRLRGAVLGGRQAGLPEVERVAALPSRAVLLAQVTGAIGAPLSGLVFTLQGVLQQLVGVLQALAEQKKNQT